MDFKTNKQALYEIYRACRLCGGSAGYKMPICQNIIPMDDVEVELGQKIKECVKIEVTMNDRMPPLICELCIDKVNNFYDFLQLCKKTNEATRLKLGLPLQTTVKTETESILGMMEPMFSENDSNGAPPASGKKAKKIKTENTEPEVKVKIEKDAAPQGSRGVSKSAASRRPGRGEATTPREKTPPRVTRLKTADDDVALSQFLEPSKGSRTNPPAKQMVIKKQDNSKSEQSPRGAKRMCRELQFLLDSPPLKVPKTENRSQRLLPQLQSRTKPTLKTIKPEKSNNQKSQDRSTQRRMSLLRELSLLKGVKIEKKSRSVKDTNPPQVGTKSPQVGKKPPEVGKKPPQVGKKPPQVGAKIRVVTESLLKYTNTQTDTKTQQNIDNKEASTEKDTESERKCMICRINFKRVRQYAVHMRTHTVSFTSPNKACDACREWFLCAPDAQRHHCRHRELAIPYRCMLCSRDFPTREAYEGHTLDRQCRTSTEVPDVKCGRCWKYFPTQPLLAGHRCWGEGDRPAMCIICNETVSASNLTKHEKLCKPKKGTLGSAQVEQEVLASLKPMQVRVVRCDRLLRGQHGGHYDVANVRVPYGLAKRYHYPYATIGPRTKIKTEPTTDNMVTINDDVKADFDYVHWDSDDDTDGTVPPLTTICLQVIYSSKMLGKVPKRRRVIADVDDSEFGVNSDRIFNSLDDTVDIDCPSSPKLGIIESYTSLVDNKQYDGDAFDAKSNAEFNSDDSQSLVTDFVFDRNRDVESVNGNNLNGLSIDEDFTEAKLKNGADTNIDANKAETKIENSIERDLELNTQTNVKTPSIDIRNSLVETEVNSRERENNIPHANHTSNIGNESEDNATEVTENTKDIDLTNETVNRSLQNEENSEITPSHDAFMGDAAIDEISHMNLSSSDENLNGESDYVSVKQLSDVHSVSDSTNFNDQVIEESGHDVSKVDNNENFNTVSSNNSDLDMRSVTNNIVNCSNSVVSSCKNDNFSIFNLLNDRISHSKANDHMVQTNNESVVNNESCSNNSISNNELNNTQNYIKTVDNINSHANDKVHYDNDKACHDIDKVHHDNNKVHHESVLDINKATNEYNKENYNATGQCITTNDTQVNENYTNEKEKVCLDDFLKSRDAELDGMDLDSISDDDFNFD